MNVPSRSILAHFAFHIVDETDLREVIWRIAVSESSVLVLFAILACARNGLGFCWPIATRTRGRGASGVLFLLPSRVVRFADENVFMKLLGDLSFDITHVLTASRRTQ